jgi:hypothetical protein
VRLHATIPGARITYAALIHGAAFHDVYHAGQIQLLKRLGSASAGGEPRSTGRR